MGAAVIYARYSSDKQDEASIDAQVRACMEYAKGKGLTVLEVYADEAISGNLPAEKRCIPRCISHSGAFHRSGCT